MTIPLRNPRFYFAAVLGVSFGVVLYSYGLVEVLPAFSRQILFYAATGSLAAAAAYFVLLERVIWQLLPQPSRGSRAALIVGSILIGAYLSYAYLDAPGSPPRYVTFLLPRNALTIHLPPQAAASESGIEILSFKTSLGDVSYNSLNYDGWIRQGSKLTLVDPTNNSVKWVGGAGDEAAITFGTSSLDTPLEITWNGASERLNLPAGEGGKYPYTHYFQVPAYASRFMLLLLGALDLIVLCLAGNLLIWSRREQISAKLDESISALLRPPIAADSTAADESSGWFRILRAEWAMVVCLLAVALAPRVLNLGFLYPYADEYSHLLAAKELLHRLPSDSVFDRSLLVVTIPVAISQGLFGIELWSARLPGAVVNALAIVPLYLLMRKINKPVAVLSCLLFASSPLIVAVARNVREYAYYPFYFYWIIYAMVLFLERVPDNLILIRDWKRLFQPNLRLLSLVLAFSPVYAVLIDVRSTFKIIMIAYVVLGVFLLRKFDLRNKVNAALLAGLAVFLAAAGGLYAQAFGHSALSLIPRFHTEALALFFPDPIQQWYFNRPPVIPLLALLAAGVICVRTARANIVPVFLAALLLACLIFFTTFFGHYFMPRYVSFMELWYVVVLSIGLYGLFWLSRLVRHGGVVVPLMVTGLFALGFNALPSLLPTLYDKQGNMPVSGEYHYNLGPAYTYLLDKVNKQDVLISNVYGGYVRWRGMPEFARIYPFGSTLFTLQHRWIFPYEAAETVDEDSRDYILSIVAANDSGWIVLDSITYASKLAKPLPLKTSLAGSKQLEYVGYFSGEYIWRWQAATKSP